jgi:hypothetical protein
VASTVGKLGTKTWSGVQSFWSGKDKQSYQDADQPDTVNF